MSLSPGRMEHSTSIPSSSYEFPNGYNISMTVEKFKITEGLFNSTTANLKVHINIDVFSTSQSAECRAEKEQKQVQLLGKYRRQLLGCKVDNY